MTVITIVGSGIKYNGVEMLKWMTKTIIFCALSIIEDKKANELSLSFHFHCIAIG